MRHELKTDPDVFDDVQMGFKSFEIRKDDRGFEEGDELLLKKTVATGAAMATGAPLEYTGDECVFVVDYILRGPIYGLAEGWVVMSGEVVPDDAIPDPH